MRVCILIVLAAFSAFAQQKQKAVNLPHQSVGQFTRTTVLAKVKPQFKGLSLSSILVTQPMVRGVKAFVPEAQQAKLRAKVAPRLSPSKVDLALYMEIDFNGGDVAAFIKQLYATGYFDIVEPDYTAKLHYTPSDPSRSNQYYLAKIRAYEAWDITKGSHEVVIGIVDTGGDLDHPDIISQLYTNAADPVDGIDNDNDGYIDNNRGWDFMGSDTININQPGFLGDNNPANPNNGLGSHGTAVAGCAAATTDNSVGIAGVGFNSKLLFTKQAADNQGVTKGTIYRGYSGILYAATHGAKIINCSWGGYVYSQIQQDLISYVSLDLGCLVVASAGNENTGVPTYPASYDHVLSVASSQQDDVRSTFSNFGKTVDIIAPGQDIFTTFFNDSYAEVDGTSFSAPITSGAAALVWSQHPTWTAAQVREQIRVTADESVYQVNQPGFANSLGKGRLDVFRALTVQLPSLRASNPKLLNAAGSVAQPGEQAFLSLDFTNYLNPTSSGLSITLTPIQSAFVTMSKGTIQPGIISTNQTVKTTLNPFKLKLNSVISENSKLDFLLTFSDGVYSDFQWISFQVNPSFLDIDENQLITTIASNGRLGYENTATQSNGVGFIVNQDNLLFEMGLMMGTSSSVVFDNVRGTASGFNQEFTVTEKIKEAIPGERSASEIYGAFTDNAITKTVSVNYRTLTWREAPYDRFIILEYKVKNISNQPLNGFYFGLFADWDITNQGGHDQAQWDDDNRLGYVYPAQPDDRPHAGIRLLKGMAPQYYAIDNNHQIPGVPFGLYDGFTDTEKFTTLSSSIGRASAGMSSPEGADVSHVVAAGPYTIPVQSEVVVAFALVAAPDFLSLKEASQYADTAYNFMLTAPKPVVLATETCYGSSAAIVATGANNFKWYKEFTGTEPFHVGGDFTTPPLFNDTTFYVSNAEESFESIRTAAQVKVMANPTILSSSTGTICEGSVVTLSAVEADSYLWNTGATTQTIDIEEAGNYSVHVETADPTCQNDSEVFSLIVNPAPISDFIISGTLIQGESISFANNSTGATSHDWDFGDGQTSTVLNPVHVYASVSDFSVSLTSINEFGCTDIATQVIQIITGLFDQDEFTLYPIPAQDMFKLKTNGETFDWKIFDVTGRAVLQGESTQSNDPVSVQSLLPGIYFIKASIGKTNYTSRFIKK